MICAFVRAAVLSLGVVLFSTASMARLVPAPDDGIAQTLPAHTLRIVSGHKTHLFKVMIARSGAQQELGLMWRAALSPNEGMLFPFPTERIASFWMRNTLISLDIIYIRSDGTIANIITHAPPFSLKPLVSTEPVQAVLEIAAGRTKALGIKPNDRVLWDDQP